jgi:hypothetical protein
MCLRSKYKEKNSSSAKTQRHVEGQAFEAEEKKVNGSKRTELKMHEKYLRN